MAQFADASAALEQHVADLGRRVSALENAAPPELTGWASVEGSFTTA